MSELEGKVAVVLGASAEAGSGWGIAEALAAAGCKVVVGARSQEPIERLAEKIAGVGVVCDVSSEEQVKNVAETALREYGKLDIAVNAAGMPLLKTISDIEQPDLETTTKVNYYANVYFVKHMAAAIEQDGSIILITSLSTERPVFPHAAYACAKAASDCLVRYAAIEYGPKNIRVNSILPGMIVSDMSAEILSAPGMMETFTREVPLGHLGYPKDYANAVLWLAGPAFVTGVNIPVAGGAQLTRFPRPDEYPDAEKAWDVDPGTHSNRGT
ncbi:MAG: SDR family oxidoreductase [Halieaceae bacterium]|nr:SDR family oxidoreductase [Halieaceae bacterium]